jgi:hypothetical protein
VHSATRLWPSSRAATSGAVRGDRASVGQIFAHLLPYEVELILCNDDKKMKSGTASPMPHALAPRQQCPRCGGARQRRLLCVATATPQSRHGGAQGRRLLRVTLRHLSVGSRFSLKQSPGVPCGGTASAQCFLSRWSQKPMAVAREGCLSPSPSSGSSLPWSCCRQASTSATRHGGPVPAPRRGGLCRRRGGAGERPPFSTLRARPNEHPSFCCARVSSWLQLTMSGHRAGFRRQPATTGPLPFKAKEVVLMLSEHETVIVLGRALQAPEVMLDDAV